MVDAGITIADGMYVIPGYGRLLPLPPPWDDEEATLAYVGRRPPRRPQLLPPTSRQTPPRPATWTVYAIGSPDGARVKIGITHDVPKRLAALQSGSPVELRLIGSWLCGNAKQVERRMHRLFAGARLHGEWFDAHSPDVAAWLASGLGPLEWLARGQRSAQRGEEQGAQAQRDQLR